MTAANSAAVFPPTAPALSWPRLLVLLALAAVPVSLTAVGMTVFSETVGFDPLRAWIRPLYLSHLGYAVASWIVVAIVLLVARGRLREAGLRLSWSRVHLRAAVLGTIAGVLIYVGVDAFLQRAGLPAVAGMDFRSARPLELAALVLGPVLTAPLAEEILFRVVWIGALSRRIATPLAVVASVAAFAAIHYPYFGIGGVIFISLWSLVPTVLFLRTGDLSTPLAMHVLNNAFAYLLGPFVPPS